MSFQKYIFLSGIFIIFTFSGCSSSAPENSTKVSNAATNTANVGAAKANADNPFNTTKKAEEATTNRAETVAPVVAAYYDALKKKDDAALRKFIRAKLCSRSKKI
jgi:hypothetical protein